MLMIKNLLFWTVFPLLIPQALYVRRTAPRFAPAAGPREGVIGVGEQRRLLAIGDSIIAGVGASELSKALVGQTATTIANTKNCRVSWQALGVSGYDSVKVLERLVPKLPVDPFDYVIVSVGVNDVTGLTTTRKWRSNLSQLIRELQAHSPGALIGLAGLPPLGGFPLLPQPLRATLGMRGRVLDAVAREVADEYQNTLHVPLDFEPTPDQFSPDGYHPSEASYVVFGQQMAEQLSAMEAVEKALSPIFIPPETG
jgi:lysophospholipase L1-like esterase